MVQVGKAANQKSMEKIIAGSVASVVFCIGMVIIVDERILAETAISGFGQYLSLVFTSGGFGLGRLARFRLDNIESAPITGFALCLGVTGLFFVPRCDGQAAHGAVWRMEWSNGQICGIIRLMKDFFSIKKMDGRTWPSYSSLFLALVIFEAGVAVGVHKASFADRIGGDYYKFSDQSMPPLADIDQDDFPVSHGVVGTIIKIAPPYDFIQGPDNIERTIRLGSSTMILRNIATSIGPS